MAKLNGIALLVLCGGLLSALTGCPDAAPPAGGGAAVNGGTLKPTVPTDPKLLSRMNQAVREMGKFTESNFKAAVQILEQIVAEEPGWLDAQTNLAIGYLNLDQKSTRAVPILEKVLAADPDLLRAMYTYAVCLRHRGESDKALPYFKKVADRDPNDAFAAFMVGDGLFAQKDYQGAQPYLERAYYIQPNFFSAINQLALCYRNLGQADKARELFALTGRLKESPRAYAFEYKYTRMGPKATMLPPEPESRTHLPMPQGALFASPVPLVTQPLPDGWAWTTFAADESASVTVCDINGDEAFDLFAAAALTHEGVRKNAVFMRQKDGQLTLTLDHPFTPLANVRSASWADWNNDKSNDVYLVGQDSNVLISGGVDTTQSAQAQGLPAHDSAFFDFDHDNDLELLLLPNTGPAELLNNDRTGAYTAIGQTIGLQNDSRPALRACVGDLDFDRDVDLMLIHDQAPHQLFVNDHYTALAAAPQVEAVANADFKAALFADLNTDGQSEIYTLGPSGLVVFARNKDGTFEGSTLSAEPKAGAAKAALALADFNGDGLLDFAAGSESGVSIWAQSDEHSAWTRTFETGETVAGWTVLANCQGGPALVAIRSGQPPLIWAPGPGRHAFAAVQLIGNKKWTNAEKSNESGIGSRAAARVQDRWTCWTTYQLHSGPGQSLQPFCVGLGGNEAIDFITVDFTEGILLTEGPLAANTCHRLVEVNRMGSSCPVLFVSDGDRCHFVTDFVGKGGLGYLVSPGVYAPPDPRESILIPPGLLQPKDGKYVLKLAEIMEELSYFDTAQLLAWDVPPGWQMVPDERLAILGPAATGRPYFFRQEMLPVAATDQDDVDRLAEVASAGDAAALCGELDRRFLGLTTPSSLTLVFPQALDAGPGPPVLVVDGWIEFPYSRTSFAAYQAKAQYLAPNLEAQAEDGSWQLVAEQFGYPGGMPRRMTFPLENLPAGTKALRLSTNQEIYWDRISVIFDEPCPQAVAHVPAMLAAQVQYCGFPNRTDNELRRPQFDYQNRAQTAPVRTPAGYYTEYGDAMPLVAAQDNGLAIVAPGEELHLEFAEISRPIAAGWTRCFVLEVIGWCKDMDKHTQDGQNVGPLPRLGPATAEGDALNEQYNTRYLQGR